MLRCTRGGEKKRLGEVAFDKIVIAIKSHISAEKIKAELMRELTPCCSPAVQLENCDLRDYVSSRRGIELGGGYYGQNILMGTQDPVLTIISYLYYSFEIQSKGCLAAK